MLGGGDTALVLEAAHVVLDGGALGEEGGLAGELAVDEIEGGAGGGDGRGEFLGGEGDERLAGRDGLAKGKVDFADGAHGLGGDGGALHGADGAGEGDGGRGVGDGDRGGGDVEGRGGGCGGRGGVGRPGAAGGEDDQAQQGEMAEGGGHRWRSGWKVERYRLGPPH